MKKPKCSSKVIQYLKEKEHLNKNVVHALANNRIKQIERLFLELQYTTTVSLALDIPREKLKLSQQKLREVLQLIKEWENEYNATS